MAESVKSDSRFLIQRYSQVSSPGAYLSLDSGRIFRVQALLAEGRRGFSQVSGVGTEEVVVRLSEDPDASMEELRALAEEFRIDPWF